MKHIKFGVVIVLLSVLLTNGVLYEVYAEDQPPSPVSYQEISSGHKHSCARTSTGQWVCWGSNSFGQIGSVDKYYAARSTPGLVPGLDGMVISDFMTGAYNSCIIDDQGALYCWGNNNTRQLGNPDFYRSVSGTPMPVSGMGSGVLAVSAGDSSYGGNGFICGLKENGDAYCWGYYYSADGWGTKLEPGLVGHIDNPKDIYSYGGHACMLSTTGIAKCWGSGEAGQLGNGQNIDQESPVQVNNLTNITSMSLGKTHTCAITGATESEMPKLWCWGDVSNGKLGVDPSMIGARNEPIEVTGLGGIPISIAAGAEHTCAVVQSEADTFVQCWGLNEEGQLGIGNTTSMDSPTTVPDSTGAIQISAGDFFTSILTNTGEIKSWGGNSEGQLGNGFFFRRQMPINMNTITEPLSDVVSGENHSCALTRAGAVYCWGRNFHGQVGNGTILYSPDPVQVVGLASDVRAIAAGTYHSCALLTGGQVKCWGYNGSGLLGTSNLDEENLSIPGFVLDPATGLPLTGVDKIATGSFHTCALMQSGSIKCWGGNTFGESGTAPNVDANIVRSPVEVPFIGEFVDVSAGDGFTCAIADDGYGYCWGFNGNGELGIGSSDIDPHPIPSRIAHSNNDVKAIDSGSTRTCLLTNTGGVSCWGGNSIDHTPVPVSGLESGVAAITTGGGRLTYREFHTCALMDTSGAVKCWGYNNFSQLGDGSYKLYGRNTPVDVLGLAGNAASITAGASSTCAMFESGSAACWGSDYQMKTLPVELVEVDEMLRPASILFSNYYEGAPQSFFVIRGLYFPPNEFVNITINGKHVGQVMSNETGALLFFSYLDVEGEYTVRVSSGQQQILQPEILNSAIFPAAVPVVGQGEILIRIIEDSTLRIKEGDGFTVGLNSDYSVFLPLIIR